MKREKETLSAMRREEDISLDPDVSFFQHLESELRKRLGDGLRKWNGERKGDGTDRIVESILIQVQHPALRRGFYISYGPGYGDRHSLQYQIGDLYRGLGAESKFYDAILFDNKLYCDEAVENDKPFVCRLIQSTSGKTSLRTSNLEGLVGSEWPTMIVSYSKIDLPFWHQIEDKGEEWEAAMIHHAALACGLESQVARITEAFKREKAHSRTRNSVVALYNVLMPMIKSQNQQDFSGYLSLFLGSIFFRWNNIYYNRITIGGKSIRGGIAIGTNRELDRHDYLDLAWRIKAIALDGLWRISERFREKGALSAAIGSIMSRNGSHNIGSHVLAALSHNVGTMPDDQELYKYIQHRMDYIATATTDRPTWCQPTMFVGEMMKRFLSQRHLLNYISRSEGLKAWEFQSDKAAKENGGRIKFHIRKIERDPQNGALKSTKDFIDYGHLENPIDLSDDVSLSIPGGIVGQHAFFTIIENIVRNAAKHDWTTPPTKTRRLKYKENAIDASWTPESINEPGDDEKTCVEMIPDGDLDVYIDMEDNPAEDNVHFIVWTRLSDVFDKMDGQPQPTDPLSKEAVEDYLKKGDLDKLPLHHHQQVELARPFIREDGSLRRENWGLAEMKISAGYLQKASIEAIGGLEQGAKPIITPVCVPDKDAREDEISDVFHLGYRFDVPRAKFILFLVDKLPGNMNASILQDFQRNGIYVKLVRDIALKTELNYQYVVMDQFGGEKNQDKVANESLKWMLPFRVIAMKSREEFLEDKVPIFKRILRKRGTFSGLDEKVTSASDYLSTMIAEGSNATDICNDIKEDVCACWVRHLIAQRKDLEGPLSLAVSVAGSQEESSGKSLITEEDIVEFAFNEGLPQAFDTYEKIGAGLPDVAANQPIIDVLRKRGERGALVYERASSYGTAKFRPDFIKRQLAAWLETCESHASFKDTISHLNAETEDITKLEAELEDVELELEKANASGSAIQEASRQKKSDLKKRIRKAKMTAKKPVDHLVHFLDSYCAQTKGLLSKYAETIATLPKGFSKALKTEGGDSKKELSLEWDAANLFPKLASRVQLRYKRHETVRNPSDMYLEALSGTQSYLNILERMGPKDYKLMAQLAENALMRILIIDERTREFLEKHKDMLVRFENMNVFVANDRKVDLELELLEKGERLPMGQNQGKANEGTAALVDLSTQAIHDAATDYHRVADGKASGDQDRGKAVQAARDKAIRDANSRYHDRYDILIIHQGIIDKWLPGASHDRKTVEAFIESLKRVFRYVVITTGRGTPANIPNSCRVLPFSTIQTTLFRQYPEKMILTDAIMNILRVKPSESENGHG